MAQEIDGANDQTQKLLGVRPKTFAYPCGQKFVGRGLDVQSYVPLVAERFLVGRSYLSEASNDPTIVDLSQAMGTAFDDMDFPQMKKVLTMPSSRDDGSFLWDMRLASGHSRLRIQKRSSSCVNICERPATGFGWARSKLNPPGTELSAGEPARFRIESRRDS
jgi:hypothetical protein